MIKAIATALVLIMGAAVILWYGNTLNSWVVGGLVGGLGALLLSIPIALVLFSYFSHHDHKSQQEDEMVLVPRGSYSLVQDQISYDNDYFDEDQEYSSEYDDEEIYESEDGDDEYLLAEQNEWEEEQSRRVLPVRYLPSRSSGSSARLPVANQDFALQMPREYYGAHPERQPLQGRKSESRPVKNVDSRDHRTDPSYSRYRSQALHAARMEAALRAEYEEESGFASARATRRLHQMQRSSQSFPPQDKGGKSRSAHDITQSSMNGYARRPRRIVDALPPQDRSRRPFSAPDDASY